MYEIRIADVSDEHILAFIRSVGGAAMAVAEGQPYDEGIKRHHHIYLMSQKKEPQDDMKADTTIRKAIQNLDKTRKGNALYSMVKSHENTPNYVLKKVFGDGGNWLDNPRIIYIHAYHRNLLTAYKGLHDAYLLTIATNSKRKKLAKKNSSYAMCLEIADALHARSDDICQAYIIEEVIKYHQEKELMLPSRSNMERYMLTIYSLFTKLDNSSSLRVYYQIINFIP